MDREIENIYARAFKYGMNPFMFDTKVIKHNVFNVDCGKIISLNIKKYKKEAKKILKEYKK